MLKANVNKSRWIFRSNGISAAVCYSYIHIQGQGLNVGLAWSFIYENTKLMNLRFKTFVNIALFLRKYQPVQFAFNWSRPLSRLGIFAGVHSFGADLHQDKDEHEPATHGETWNQFIITALKTVSYWLGILLMLTLELLD